MINKNKLLGSKHFCILPFISSRIWHSLVVPCCINHDTVFGLSNEKSLDEIYSNDNAVLTDFRQQLLNGPELPSTCSRCNDCEKSNVFSMRQSANNTWAHIMDQLEFDDNNNLIENKFYFWDGVGYSNLCNLKCRMCPSYLSSSTRAEEIKHNLDIKPVSPIQSEFIKNYKFPEKLKGNTIESFNDINDFYKFFEKHIDYIEEIKFEGGEPMMLEQHYRILELLVEKNKTDVVLKYPTNMTTLSLKHYNVLDLWKKFKTVRVSISLDAYGDQNHYIRHPSIWEEIVENIKRVRAECPHVKIDIITAIQILNSFAATKLHKWALDNDLPINFNFLKYPSYLSLYALPKVYKQRVQDHWDDYKKSLKDTTAIDGFLRMMWAENNSNLIPEFLNRIEERDLIRKESLLETFPEFKELYD
jgi:MoaA/NifB/PqqE/SkfB family radical SAM enzyme